MKNSIKCCLITFLIFFLTTDYLAQTASRRCSQATEIEYRTYLDAGVDSTTGWYKFESNGTSAVINIINASNSNNNRIYKLEVFSGTCSGLTRICVDSLAPTGDSLLFLNCSNLTSSTECYLKLSRICSTNQISNLILSVVQNTSSCAGVWTFTSSTYGLHNWNYTYSATTANTGYELCNPTTYTLIAGPYTLWGAPSNSFQVSVSTTGSPSNYTVGSAGQYTFIVPFTATSSASSVVYTACVSEIGSTLTCQCITFTILPKISPAFTIQPSYVCANQTICITPTFQNPAHTWTLQSASNAYTSSTVFPCFTISPGTSTLTHLINHQTLIELCSATTSSVITANTLQATCSYSSSCNGTTTFSASTTCGGPNLLYNWSFGDGSLNTVGPTASVVSHNYVVSGNTQTFVVTLIVSNGNYSTTCTQTITAIGNANATIFGPASLCGTITTGQYSVSANQSITSISWSATNATVTPGAYNTANITFANTATTNVVTATVATANGCTTTVSFSVYPCCAMPSEGYVLNDYVGPPVTTHSGNIVITGTFVVGANTQLHLGQANVYMSPNARILVNGTGTLLVTDSYIHGCNYMWDGIYLMYNSNVKFDQVYVSDAQRVIVDTLRANTIDLNDFVFFTNYKGIVYINSEFASSNPGTTTLTTMNNGIITSATVPVTFPITLAYNSSSTTIGAYSKTLLQPPYGNKYANSGIEMLNTKRTTTVGTNEYRIPVKTILFDKLEWGVYLRGSHATITECIFQKSPVYGSKYFNSIKTGGIYIGPPVATGLGPYNWFNGTHVNDVLIGGSSTARCVFYENNYAVLNESPARITINNNYFNRQCYGVYINDNWLNKPVEITENEFYENGYFTNKPATAVSMINNYVVDALIAENTFSNSSAYGSHSNNYGVYCTEVTNLAGADYTIDDNRISGLFNGVFLGNTKDAAVTNNTITIRPDYGGIFNFQQGITASNSYSTDIFNNEIYSPNNNNLHGYDWHLHQLGVLLDYSTVSSVRCNLIEDMPVSIKAQGICNTAEGDGILGNQMKDAHFGFWLDNFGEVGDQFYATTLGGTRYSADNAWTNPIWYTVSSASSNFTISIPNTNPKFYSRSSAPIPNNLCNNLGGANPFYGTNNSSNVDDVCNAPNLPRLLNTAMPIASGDLEFDGNPNQIKLSRRALYRNLLLDSITVDTNEVLEDFVNLESVNSNGKHFDWEEQLMAVYSATSESQFISWFNELVELLLEAPLTDKQDENQRIYNAMLIYQIATKTNFDSLDLVLLETIAEQCPLEGGMAVLQARAHLWPYTGLKYVNDCELQGAEYGGGERRANLLLKNTIEAESPSAFIYPNPANDELYIELLNCNEARIELFDISGRSCLSKDLEGPSKLNMAELTNGLYLYKVYSKNKLIKTGKLILSE